MRPGSVYDVTISVAWASFELPLKVRSSGLSLRVEPSSSAALFDTSPCIRHGRHVCPVGEHTTPWPAASLPDSDADELDPFAQADLASQLLNSDDELDHSSVTGVPTCCNRVRDDFLYRCIHHALMYSLHYLHFSVRDISLSVTMADAKFRISNFSLRLSSQLSVRPAGKAPPPVSAKRTVDLVFQSSALHLYLEPATSVFAPEDRALCSGFYF